MPIYEYNCKKCNASFESLIRTKSDTPAKCPKCGASDISKAFSAFAVSVHSHSSECKTCPSTGSACPGGSCPYSG